jgi:hypothetical protein
LIRFESDPYRFLQHKCWRPKKAAELLARHWKLRIDLFGEEWTFLPLKDLSGTGALSQDDIYVLQTGFCSFLPDDTQGRTVVFGNPNLHGRDAEMALPFDASFTCYTLAAEKGQPVVVVRYQDDGKGRRDGAPL